MNFKKRVNGSWTDTPHYIHNTSTDTLTTLPAVLYPNDTTATVGLKGNTTQSGTPTPTAPIYPTKCGDKTANLWDEEYEGISQSLTYKPVYLGDGQYTLSSNIPFTGGTANIFFLAGNVSSGASTATNGVYDGQARTVSSVEGYVTIVYRNQTENPKLYNTMLNTGSTALPYEPFGVKIPILSADTTTPVYLGEVQSTRRIKKIKASDITWIDGSTTGYNFYRGNLTIPKLAGGGISTLLSNKYRSVETRNNLSDGDIASYNITTVETIVIRDDRYSSAADWLSANGDTEIWYVLAEPTTGIVNEPLMRIGDYADTLSNVSIPVTAGGDTISVGTTVQPSEVTVNYKGWHPVADVHERENGQWD